MRLLVFRFSSIGDVALTVPVLLQCKAQYPEVEITVVSRKMYRPLFEPLGFAFIEADLSGEHKGINGLSKLYRKIWKQAKPDKVLDLHSVMRTHVLQALFKLRKTPFYRIDKGRQKKKQLVRRENKIRQPLMHSTARYAKVFEQAGFPLDFDLQNPPLPPYQSNAAKDFSRQLEGKTLAGIAPIAAFPGKTWPLTKMEELIAALLAKAYTVVLFGGPGDRESLEKLKAGREEIILMPNHFGFAGEIVFMRALQFMVSMDSANMHLATLAGIPVVSVWGATHPFAGFGPLGKNDHLQAAIPVEELGCRPCSVFGNQPCFRKDYACLHWLKAEDVLQKTEEAGKPS